MRLRHLVVGFGLALLVASPGMAQVGYTGSLFLNVEDEDGSPVEGATIQLKGPDFTREQTTNAGGNARFINLLPATYEMEIAATGFNTLLYPRIVIDSLANVELDATLQRSDIVEQVVVTAETPLLDKRETGTQTILTQEEITQIPQNRDPWSVLQTIPGVTTDRINVGGNEAGQQATFVGKGDDGQQSTWIMDGVDFTDPAAEGATSSYLDFNAFEQIGFVTAGADVEQATPGMRLNFVQKQGSNRHSGDARFVYTELGLQADATRSGVGNPITGLPADQPTTADGVVLGNGVNETFEKNFSIGGPIIGDTWWYWFGFTQTDIELFLANTRTLDATELRNITIKTHGQHAGRLTWRAFWTEGDKIKDGRTSVANRSIETTWNQAGPSPITSGAISYFFTPNFELSAQVSEVDGGFGLSPKAGTVPSAGSANPNMGSQIVVTEAGTWTNTFIDFMTERPTDQWAVRGNWFADALGWDHEVKFGFRYKETERTSTSRYGGDGVLAFRGPGGLGGSAYLYRDGDFTDVTDQLNAWVGNTMLRGPWAINYGLHYSLQEGEQLASTVPGNTLCSSPTGCGPIPVGVPDLVFPGFDPSVEWEDLLPRVGVTYTFDWEHRLLLRANFAQYVDSIAHGDIGFNNPVAPSSITYPWDDLNGDNLVQLSELGPDILATSNFDPGAPSAVSSPDEIDPNLEAPQVDELIFGAEYEVMRNFTVGANLTLRQRDNELWAPLYDVPEFLANGRLVALGPEIYSCDTITGSYPSAGGPVPYSEPLCFITDVSRTTTARNTFLTNRGDYEAQYSGIELTATKRLSNRWMVRGFLAFSDWEQQLDPFNGGLVSSDFLQGPPSGFGVPDGDPTNFGGDLGVDGGQVSYQSAGSGSFRDIWPGSSRWQANVNGLYQLPLDFTISANIQAREGYAIPLVFVNDGAEQRLDADGIRARKNVQIGTLEDHRYDDIFLVDLKLTRLFQLGGDTTVELAVEGFNVFDDDTVTAAARAVDSSSYSAPFGQVNQLVSPQIFRFGATVNF